MGCESLFFFFFLKNNLNIIAAHKRAKLQLGKRSLSSLTIPLTQDGIDIHLILVTWVLANTASS
jgi:hypothetical protein